MDCLIPLFALLVVLFAVFWQDAPHKFMPPKEDGSPITNEDIWRWIRGRPY